MRRLRVVMLLTDGFGGFGGISRFNRDFLWGLDSAPDLEGVTALPRLIPEPIEEPIPERVVYDRAAARGAASYVARALAGAARGRTDLVICGHLHLLPLAWIVARARGARLFLIVHGIDAWTPSRHRLANALCKRLDGVISPSLFTAERFAKWSGVSMARVHLLPNCVDLRRFRPGPPDPALRARYGLGDSRVLLTVGRIEPTEQYKGFDEVIEILPELSGTVDVKYLIVGDGPDRPRLEDKARSLGVAHRVVFAGKIDEAEKVAHYNIADAYVMPSSGEGFGIVFLEAAGCGVPLVGSKVDGSREALRDGAMGHLVDPSSRAELLAAVKDVLSKPKSGDPIPGIETFDVSHFRARVRAWLAEQAARGEPAPRRSADAPPMKTSHPHAS